MQLRIFGFETRRFRPGAGQYDGVVIAGVESFASGCLHCPVACELQVSVAVCPPIEIRGVELDVPTTAFLGRSSRLL